MVSDIFVLSGTFAVISLMVANAVEKANCTDSDAVNGGTDASSSNSTAEYRLYTTTSSSVENISELDKHSSRQINEVICKLGFATAVTFLAGIIQVGTVTRKHGTSVIQSFPYITYIIYS